MKRPSLFLLSLCLASPAVSGPKVEVTAAEVRTTGGVGTAAAPAANAALAIRSNLNASLANVTSLSGVPALAPTPGLLAPAAVLDAPAPLRAPLDAPGTGDAAKAGALDAVNRIAAGNVSPEEAAKAPVEDGRSRGARDFDAATMVPGDGADGVAGAWKPGESRLLPATAAERRAERAPARPFKDAALDAAEAGAFAAAFHILAGILFLAAGAHAAHPILAGALWGLAASETIKHIARMHGRIVGGWQASHDQKMRHDYGTGELKDIRGHAYGEDRYDKWAPGEVSTRARAAIDVLSVLMGLPWVLGGGPTAVALYLASAGSLIALRRLLAARAARTAPAVPVETKPFEYDR